MPVYINYHCVIAGGIPEHQCRTSPTAAPNASVPRPADSSCYMYRNLSVSNATVRCRYGYDYYGDVGPTIASEWDLVCDRAYLIETSQTVMVIGVLVGAIVFTTLADNYGRKPIFLFSQCAMVVVGVATAFINSYYMFAALRLFAGALQQGIILTGFIMTCELFPANMRTLAGMSLQVFWAIGMCLLALLAYFIRHWRYLQLAITLPAVATVAFFWILPESIPWLCANDRTHEAEEIMKQAFRMNGKAVPEYILLRPPESTEAVATADGLDHAPEQNGRSLVQGLLTKLKLRRKSPAKSATADEKTDAGARYTLLDVLKHPRLSLYAFVMCLLWFVNSLVYYGLSLNTSAIAGDRYINFFLSGLVEVPAYITCIFVLQRYGRRWSVLTFHIVSGVALIVTTFIPEKTAGGTSLVPLLITCNMIGKFGITGSFGAVFLYAPEIFPTTLRSQAMGISSLGGRLGNMLSPFASLVAREVPWLPGIIFGVLSVIVGLLTLLLPETMNRPLPQTIEDIENWSQPTPSKHELTELMSDVTSNNMSDS
ncbi:hypothetical protein NP493_613g03003 [Ridgeia piscesae]|uniref:Major facilitator superfamily (MFS) profile domain-containing protein n=1 Tax=Ridgeia piscesae TaxID=27915 RepID=A0AAD9KTV7_RIDPI|nr:hypothetical protein NP493_613g03003 [Ridgeia piscesae]